MPTTMPTVSLLLAAALAILNIWLGFRVGQVRTAEKVSVGDGGNERVTRRMRAHANFAENAWVVLALVLAIELSLGTSAWLWGAAAAFLVARIAHALGMDGWLPGRMGGIIITFTLQLALALWAIAIPFAYRAPATTPAIEAPPAQG